MDREEFDELIEEPFNVPDLAMIWEQMLRLHRDMGFAIPLTDKDKGTKLSDNEMIAEFQWIYSQYKKFIGTKKASLLQLKGNLPSMLATLKQLIEKSSDTPTDRPTLVYQCMRNQWLQDTWNHVAWILEQQMKEEDDE